MARKITWENIKAFVEGNVLLLGDDLNLLPDYLKEQVEYRASKCYESCYKGNEGKCLQCGCRVPGKWYATKTCNEEKFPDIMSEEDWNKYKLEIGYGSKKDN